MNTTEQASVKVSINDADAQDRFRALTARAQELRTQMSELRKANDKAGFDKLQKELKETEKESKRLKEGAIEVQRVLKDLNGSSLNELERAQKKVVAEMKSVKDRGSEAYTQLKDKVRLLNTEINQSKAELRETTPLLERANNIFNNYSGSIMAAVAALAALALSFKEIYSLIADFEQGIANIKTSLSKEDGQKYGESLEKGVINTMREYGSEMEDANQALFDIVSAGVSANDALVLLDQGARLGVASVSDLAVTTDGMTTVMNAWGLKISEAEQIASAFFAAQKDGKGPVKELAAEIGKIAPIANMAGVSYQEILAALAEMTKRGISTSESVTYLKSAISSLLNPTAEAEKLLKKNNVAFGVSGLKATGFVTVLDQLNAVAQKNPDIMSKMITSVEGLAAVTTLSGEGLEDYKKILKGVNTDFGEGSGLAQAFAIQQETLNFQMAKARQSTVAMILEMKNSLRPTLIELVKLFSLTSNLLKKFFGWVNKNKEEIAAFGKVLFVALSALASYRLAILAASVAQRAGLLLTQGVTLAIQAYIVATQVVTGKIKVATAAQMAFNTATKLNPLALIISILGAAGAAFLAYRDNVKEATEEQKRFLELQKEAEEAIKGNQSVQELAKTMDKMNVRQLENLKIRAQKELEVYEDINLKKEELLRKYNDMVQVENRRAEKMTTDEATRTALMNNKIFRAQSNAILKELSLLGETQSNLSKFELDRILQNADIKLKQLLKLEADATKPKPTTDEKAKKEKKKKEEKDPRLKALEDLQEEGKKINDRLELERLEQNERELEQIRRLYDEKIAIALAGEARNDEYSAAFATERAKLELWKAEELAAKKLEQEKRFEEARDRVRKEYGLVSLDEQMQSELDLLKERLDQKLVTVEQYEQTYAAITARYAEIRRQAQTEAIEKSFAKYREAIDRQMFITATFAEFFSNSKEAELEAAGENEAKKKEIQKRYALPEFLIAAAEIGAQTATGIMKAIAMFPLTGGMPWAGFVGAAGIAQLAVVAAQKAKVAGLEQGGSFPVRRAQDNRLFQARYAGQRRGYFNRPTVLVGEGNLPEYVVSSTALANPAVRHLTGVIEAARMGGRLHQIDYDSIVESIHTVRGYQTGGYTTTTGSAPATTATRTSEAQRVPSYNEFLALVRLVADSNEANRAMVHNLQVRVDPRKIKEANDATDAIIQRTTLTNKE